MGFTIEDERAEKFDRIKSDNQAIKDGKAGVGYGNYLTGTAPTVTTPTVTTQTNQPPGYDANGNKTVVTGTYQSGSATFDGGGIPNANTTPSTESGQTGTPAPTEKEKKPSGALGYGAWLEQSGNDTQAAYERAVAAARRQYAMNRASFGVRGEQLGRAGLTGSGYGDYLEGKAYASMVGAEATAEAQKAEGDRQNAIGYASYLTAKDNEAYQKRVGLYDALVKTGSTDRATLEQIAKIYAPDMDAAELEEVLGAAMSVGTANRQNTVNSLVGTLLGKTDGTVSKEAYTTLIKDVLPDATDDEIASIIGQVETTTGTTIKPQEEIKETNDKTLADERAIIIRQEATTQMKAAEEQGIGYTIADWELAAKHAGYSEEDIEIGRQAIYDYGNKYISDMIESATSIADMTYLSADEINSVVGKTIDQPRADALIKSVQRKTNDFLKSAYDAYKAGEDERMADILGVNAEEWANLSDSEKVTALFDTAVSTYKDGKISGEQLDGVIGDMIQDTLESEDTNVSSVSGLAILLSSNMKDSGDGALEDKYKNYMEKIAEKIEVKGAWVEGKWNIKVNGNQKTFLVSTGTDTIDGSGKKELIVKDGILYACEFPFVSARKVIGVNANNMTEDQCKAMYDLLVVKFSK